MIQIDVSLVKNQLANNQNTHGKFVKLLVLLIQVEC